MARIELRGVSKAFGEVRAVDDVSLEVADREFLALLGPSGCGKTTTLRLIAGLETPTSGEILIDGAAVTRVEPQDRDLAMVFQNYALYPHLTVAENLAFPFRKRSLPKREVQARVRAVAATLGIGDLLGRRPGQLSGGQRQRVALGRAIIREPRAFLMDEPLSNLDAETRVQMRAELKRLHRELRRTFVFVTHDQVEAMSMADRIAVFDRGRVVQLAAPRVLYDRPATTFVARFVGSPAMNLLPVRLAGGTLRGDGWEIAAPPEVATAAGGLDGGDALLGVRPGDVRLGPAGGGPLVGRVDVIEPLGDTTLVDLFVGEQAIRAITPADAEPAEGERVGVAFAPGKTRLFDAATGLAATAAERPVAAGGGAA